MFALSKRRIIAGAWTCAGTAACLKLLSNHRRYQDMPCVQLALSHMEEGGTLGAPLKLGMWPRQGHVDSNAGLMRARFNVIGPNGTAQILVGAKRDRLETDTDLDDESSDGYYWLRPWELKKAFLNKVRSISSVRSEDQDPAMWRIETLVVVADGKDPQVILGNPLALPEYEAACLRRDGSSKDERSRRRLYIALGISLIATALAGGVRVFRSRHVWQSHGHLRKAVLGDQSIQTVLGPSYIESCNGTFTPTYINAQLKLVGNTGAVADVMVAASRNSTWQHWHVALARMNVGGVVCNLNIELTQ